MNPVETLMTDTADIYRYIGEENTYGRTVQKKTLVLEKIRCRVSFASVGSTTNENYASKSVRSVKLFVPADVALQAGDVAVILREGEQIAAGKCSLAAVYPTHREYSLEEEHYA